jgi:hypothetical protein
VAPWLKGLVAGVLIGAIGALMVKGLAADREGIPNRLADALECPSPIPETAASAHHAHDGPYGYSWFAATHAERILYIGCETGPGTTYMRYGSAIDMGHMLATLHHHGAVCLVGQAVFDGKLLNGRAQLEELCASLDGKLEVFKRQTRLS